MPFSPTDIAGCKIWLDAGTLSLSDGDPISTWTDGSGTGNFTGTSSTRPIYKTNVINGLPVARFDGSDDILTTTTSRVVTDFSMFFVVKQTGDGALLGKHAESNPQTRVGQGGSDVLSAYDGANNPQSSTLGVAQGNFSILEFVRSGSTVTFYQNGTSYSSGTLSGSLTFDQLGAFVFSANPLNGDVAETIMYDSALGTTDRQSVETYLTNKYFSSPPPPPSFNPSWAMGATRMIGAGGPA